MRPIEATAKEAFFQKIRTYTDLSKDAERAWSAILRPERYRKGESLIQAGTVPATFAYVVKGLFSQHYVGPEGNTVIKYFFPEERIAASVSATLLGQPSLFTITAIEDSSVLVYEFASFNSLVVEFSDIAAFYIRYMERHWIIEKEPGEIAFRHDDAMKRYRDFVNREPLLYKRLNQHHIAAWLGITPESLSRIRKAITLGG
ncbi:Crp/Fnr family transcriptional regulator [Halomonas sp. SpR8]|uniref:Crp/Fnr family transcriptional regulator n=1 Tax=Halomonas sp. SpR8 TaxID=3050463 RepID=UPI0027E4467C|nr:Crp/Fnr family transcriptional regulator [Halomonas sp. SpR8]MDQ7730742.1 Crp/Fnr family transcriptional regulator [Halomonas sp. SpR8]